MSPNPLLTNPRPWCMGRLVMNRPAQSEIFYEHYEFVGHKFEIAENVTIGTFQHKVTTRETELRSQKRSVDLPLTKEMMRNGDNGIRETDIPWLEQNVSPNSNSRLFIYRQYQDDPSSLFDGEGYILAGSNMLSMKFLLDRTAVQKVIQRDSEWFRRVTYREDWTVPTEPGFCIQGALIGGPSLHSEVAEQSIILMPGHLSLFIIKMRDAVDVDQQSSLLKGLPDLRQELRSQGYSHYARILREGKRTIAGMDAEEVLFSIKEGNLQLFRFYLIAPGSPDTTAQPHTEIQLMLGNAPTAQEQEQGTPQDQLTSPVDEAGAIQAWDTLLDSIHLRPGAM